ncbi:AAA family ATPase [Candidatus Hepatoplasma crinochetorum]|uniref:AAA family ATPase n=1 Tax=Candidatus Hepatoplasma crinochetorum TaxID=295596 RepID=UPI0030889A8D|nr:MAG: hypothetical protein HCTKY_2820 [Candidatus Hepatoplasma crinochetorum]
MKLAKIYIKRFKNIENLEINFEKYKNLISIIGLNNIGKTNILEAIYFFETLKIRKLRKNEEKFQNVSFFYKLEEDDQRNFDDYFLEMKMQNQNKNKTIEKNLNEKHEKTADKTYKKSITNWDKLQEFEITVGWDDEIRDYVRFFTEEITDSKYFYKNIYEKNKFRVFYFDKTQKKDFLENQFFIKSKIFRKILKSINHDHFIKNFYKYNDIELNIEIGKIEKAISTFLFSNWNDRENEKYIVKLILLDRKLGKFSLIINNKNNKKNTFQPEESSDGLISIIFMKLSIGETFFKRLILIDEPNTFLHSLAQINLLNYFKSIITKNDCKLIYTTHSEHLVDSEIPIIYKNKNNWEIKIIKDIKEYQDIQLKVLANNLLINNPINLILNKEKDFYKFIEFYNKKEYKMSLTFIHTLLEKEINIFIYKLNLKDKITSKSTIYDKLKLIFEKVELDKIKINLPIEKQLIEIIKNNFKNSLYLASFRNKASYAHINNIKDRDLENIIPIVILTYLANIEFLRRFREIAIDGKK